MEIYFDDLKEEIQKEILDCLKISSPKEMNWDLLPMANIESEVNNERNSKNNVIINK